MKSDIQGEISKILSYFTPFLENQSQLLRLSFQYLSLAPFNKQQFENLEFVYNQKIAYQMLKNWLETGLSEFLTNVEAGAKKPSILNLILNRNVFERNMIENDASLLQLYKNQSNIIDSIPSKQYYLFDARFQEIAVRFLNQPYYSSELTLLQKSLGGLLTKLGAKFEAMDLPMMSVMSYSTVPDVWTVMQKMEDLETASVDREMVQQAYFITQVVANSGQKELLIKLVQWALSFYQMDTRNQQIEVIEKFYGLSLLLTCYLQTKERELFQTFQLEFEHNVVQISTIVEKNPNFTASLRNLIKNISGKVEVENFLEWM